MSTKPHFNFKDIAGKRFGRYVALSIESTSPDGHSRWICQCDCGIKKTVSRSNLVRGTTKSCGCLQRETARKQMSEHGLSKTKIYRRWRGMLARCYCKSTRGAYPRYGGRGIIVCKRWRDDFTAFVKDMGMPPTQRHTIERNDNDGNYEPGNCRWALPIEQQNNKRSNVLLTVSGKTQTMTQWCREVGISVDTYVSRRSRGWTVEAALFRRLQCAA